MYRENSVAIVVPCFNESTQIQRVIDTMPDYVDVIYTINDCSKDNTLEVLHQIAAKISRVKVLNHETNRGVGAAIGTGYLAACEDGIDITVVMAGDGQMDPRDLPALLDPIVDDEVDYAKGNRFMYSGGIKAIPRIRLFGNFVLSALTKMSSGYWNVSDTQCGYTAVNLRALQSIDSSKIYPRYGCPNDILTKLNIANMRVADVPVAPLYNVGEISKMKIPKIIFPILRLLWRNFKERLFEKYIVRSGHPLVIAFGVSGLLAVAIAILAVYLLMGTIATGNIPKTALIIAGISSVVGLQLFISALEMDFNDNRPLQIDLTLYQHRKKQEAQ